MKLKILLIIGLLIMPVATAINIDLINNVDYVKGSINKDNLLTEEHVNENMDRLVKEFIINPYTEKSWKLFYPEHHRKICDNIFILRKFIIRFRIRDFCK